MKIKTITREEQSKITTTAQTIIDAITCAQNIENDRLLIIDDESNNETCIGILYK